jgi:Cysteine-rich CPXCG
MNLDNNENEFDLDEEFPLGDGTADTSADVFCPYCAAPVEIVLDPGSGSMQEYVEDCEVCCQPWRVVVHYGEDGSADVEISALSE